MMTCCPLLRRRPVSTAPGRLTSPSCSPPLTALPVLQFVPRWWPIRSATRLRADGNCRRGRCRAGVPLAALRAWYCDPTLSMAAASSNPGGSPLWHRRQASQQSVYVVHRYLASRRRRDLSRTHALWRPRPSAVSSVRADTDECRLRVAATAPEPRPGPPAMRLRLGGTSEPSHGQNHYDPTRLQSRRFSGHDRLPSLAHPRTPQPTCDRGRSNEAAIRRAPPASFPPAHHVLPQPRSPAHRRRS